MTFYTWDLLLADFGLGGSPGLDLPSDTQGQLCCPATVSLIPFPHRASQEAQEHPGIQAPSPVPTRIECGMVGGSHPPCLPGPFAAISGPPVTPPALL